MITPATALDFRENAFKREAEAFNAMLGKLTGYDCPFCCNKGQIAVIDGKTWYVTRCSCRATRAMLKRLEASGLGNLFDKCTFSSFIPQDSWQQQILQGVKQFTDTEPQHSWLFLGGQPGAGKTHLCTAAVGEYLRNGKNVRYMLWVDDSAKLKATVNEYEAYGVEIEALKKVDVLYIDDFFKTEREKTPTTADIRLAFEILNYRYNTQGLITIISTEYFSNGLLKIDEALGSRIIQRSKGFIFEIDDAEGRNHRLKGGAI